MEDVTHASETDDSSLHSSISASCDEFPHKPWCCADCVSHLNTSDSTCSTSLEPIHENVLQSVGTRLAEVAWCVRTSNSPHHYCTVRSEDDSMTFAQRWEKLHQEHLQQWANLYSAWGASVSDASFDRKQLLHHGIHSRNRLELLEATGRYQVFRDYDTNYQWLAHQFMYRLRWRNGVDSVKYTVAGEERVRRTEVERGWMDEWQALYQKRVHLEIIHGLVPEGSVDGAVCESFSTLQVYLDGLKNPTDFGAASAALRAWCKFTFISINILKQQEELHMKHIQRMAVFERSSHRFRGLYAMIRTVKSTENVPPTSAMVSGPPRSEKDDFPRTAPRYIESGIFWLVTECFLQDT